MFGANQSGRAKVTGSNETAGLMALLVLTFLGENIRAPGGGGRGDSLGGLWL